jgi:glycerophosphoryl diester phosphodiesterase
MTHGYFDGDGNQVTASALTTTSHTAFEMQTLQDSWYFRRGEHELMFRVDPNAYQNFNVDYFELELN